MIKDILPVENKGVYTSRILGLTVAIISFTMIASVFFL